MSVRPVGGADRIGTVGQGPTGEDGGAWPAVVHLVGRPGAGKRTVAVALKTAAAERGRMVVLLDNHRTGNVVLSLIDADGRSELPTAIWDRVEEVREAVFRTVEGLSPPEWSFVVTNVVLADDPRDIRVAARVRRLAFASGRSYVPVVIRCDEDELLRRVPGPDRRALHKWTDPEGVRASLGRPLLVPDGAIELDVTRRSPEAAALWLLDHLEGL